jgi:hypothetical protein
MKSRRRTIRRLRALALAFAACVTLAAPAAAEPGADYPQPSSTKIGDTPADFPGTPGAPESSPVSRPDAPPTLIEAGDAGGFDWISAAIGAGGAGVLIVASMGGIALTARRR